MGGRSFASCGTGGNASSTQLLSASFASLAILLQLTGAAVLTGRPSRQTQKTLLQNIYYEKFVYLILYIGEFLVCLPGRPGRQAEERLMDGSAMRITKQLYWAVKFANYRTGKK
ncbi:MAG: hypothetical protein AB7O96_02050 [Pseudobdellovibrionaceae bacterium]